ncbi:hypothetical protein CRG98_017101 [Punica granatum]|uniref:Uncharacterized protein n=1 Tax=Punica granatum TaxID=22663 RepID=A0A2I0K1P8_PUNGR|nr:hypothetical protein CRG98_017101 [Punica granatum]
MAASPAQRARMPITLGGCAQINTSVLGSLQPSLRIFSKMCMTYRLPRPSRIVSRLDSWSVHTLGPSISRFFFPVLGDELREIGKPISDEDLVTYALADLPKEYESFVTTNANDWDPLTFETLRTNLTHQQKRLEQFYSKPTSISVTTQPTALQTLTQTARGGGHSRGGRGNCGRDRGGRNNSQWRNIGPNWGNNNWTPQMSGGRGTSGRGAYNRGGFS